jgi:hypothetical protein
MTNIAAGNDTITVRANARSASPDATWRWPRSAIENASPARTVIRKNKMPAIAALEAVAAAPQPPMPASRSTLESAAPNQSSSRKAKQKMTVAIRIRVRSPWKNERSSAGDAPSFG